jgi:S-adenosylmethionine decarboxylase
MDYKVRGFTRDISGRKHYIDHNITSIQNYIAKDTQESYQMIDVNVYQENIFHTKMMLKETELENYLFEKESNLSDAQKAEIEEKLHREVTEIFYGHNYRRKKIKVAGQKS